MITLITDWGTKDYYVGMVKAKILSRFPDQKVIDISHDIPPFDIESGAFNLKAIFADLPENTIHVLSVSQLEKPVHIVLASYQNRYIITYDNGVFNTLDFSFDKVISLGLSNTSSFPEIDVFIPAIFQLKEGKTMEEIGELYEIKLKSSLSTIYNGQKIVAAISHIDTYGNIMLNVSDTYFEEKRKGRAFTISVRSRRYTVDKISHHFQDVKGNEMFAIFNRLGLLEIGMKYVNMRELLNLSKEEKVLVRFLD